MPVDKNDFTHFMNQARMKLTGASDAGIKSELFEVLREFFEGSNSWRHATHFNVVAGQQKYFVEPDDGGQIIRLLGVEDGNHCTQAAFMPEFGEIHVRYPINVTTVQPLTAPPYPIIANAPWRAWFVENIKLPTTNDLTPIVPKWVFKVYQTYLLDGLLGKMMSQEGKSYTNDEKAAYHLRRFLAGIQIVRTAANRANTVGAQNWRYPRGWSSGSQRGYMSTPFPPETTF
jgi:hypothetical protein